MTDTTDNAVTDLATDSFVAASPNNLDYMLQLQDQGNASKYAPKVHGHTISDTTGLQAALDSKSDITHLHDDRYYTETETDEKLATKSDVSHLHDDRYYTETEMNSKLAGKSDVGHLHDDRYFTEEEMTAKLATKSDTTHRHNNATTSADGFMAASDKSKLDGVEAGANLVTNVSELVNDSDYQTGAEVTAAINQAVSATLKWQGAVETVEDLPATSTKGYVYHVNENGGEYAWDGTQWVELGSVIEHKWDSITGKPSTFTPSAHTHSQADITGLAASLAGKSDTGHTHDDRYYTEAEVNSKLATKSDTTHTHDDRYFTEAEVTSKLAGKSDTSHTHAAATTSTNGFMSAADKTKLDGIATGANKITVDASLSSTSTNPVQNKAVNAALAGKANTSHTHEQSDIDGLADALAGKAAASHKHAQSDITGLADTLAGKASTNHTHGAATSSANGFMSATDKAKLDGIASGANKYTHPNSAAGAKASGLYKITTDAQGHVTGATAVAKADITALGIPSTNTTYGLATTSANGLLRQLDGSTAHYMRGDGTWATPPNTTYGVVTQSANGLMSAADKKKLDSITIDGSGNVEVDITIDTALSTTSTNPVQNRVVTAAINGKAASSHTHGVATSSANGFLSATDKAKLDGIASGANKTTVDTALSATSTNPVQNKVINSALAGKAASSHTHNYAASPSAGGAATYAYLPRVSQDANTLPGANRGIWHEYSSGAANLPSLHYYHVFTGQGSDGNYNTQLALGMTTNGIYYRNRNAGTWGGWTKVYTTANKPTASEIGAAATNHTHSGYAASSHNHAASNITSGTLSIDRLPTVTVAKGGTGATTAAQARTNLGITPANIGAAASSHNHSASNITSGTLPVSRGGTGQTSAAAVRNSLGLGNTTGAVPIANGGTGATTAAQARANLGITASKPYPDNDELIAYCGL